MLEKQMASQLWDPWGQEQSNGRGVSLQGGCRVRDVPEVALGPAGHEERERRNPNSRTDPNQAELTQPLRKAIATPASTRSQQKGHSWHSGGDRGRGEKCPRGLTWCCPEITGFGTRGSFSGASVAKPLLFSVPALVGRVTRLHEGLPVLPPSPAPQVVPPPCAHSRHNRGLPEAGTERGEKARSRGKRRPGSATTSGGTPGAPGLPVPHPALPTNLSAPPKNTRFSQHSRGNPALGSLLPSLSTTVISVHTKTPTPAHANQTSKTQTYEGIELISSEPGKKKKRLVVIISI